LLILNKVAERLRAALPQMQGVKKVLVTAPPTLINHVSLYLVCAPIHAGANRILFMSVDRPNESVARLIERHCNGGPQVLFANPEMDAPRPGDVSCVTGLFAPKLMVDALGHMSDSPDSKASMVVSNLSALGYYNSNDRVREFLKRIDDKLREQTILKAVLVTDRTSSYILSMAREFSDKEIDLSR
jgi:hypothetical protein